jgi:hypothetical protein
MSLMTNSAGIDSALEKSFYRYTYLVVPSVCTLPLSPAFFHLMLCLLQRCQIYHGRLSDNARREVPEANISEHF